MESIYAPTQQVSSDDYLEKMRQADIESKRIQRQFGGKNSPAPVGISYNDQRQGLNKYITSDMDRRTTALGNAGQLAKSIDNRNADVARQSSALDTKEGFLNEDALTQQSQQLRQNDLQTLERNQAVKNSGRNISFKSMQNRDAREMAVLDSLQKGEMQSQLTKAATEHGVAMQDIDAMFNKMMADIDNDFKDWEMGTKSDNQQLFAKLERTANNNAAIVSGATSAVGAVANNMMKNDGKTVTSEPTTTSTTIEEYDLPEQP